LSRGVKESNFLKKRMSNAIKDLILDILGAFILYTLLLLPILQKEK
jgi:hypothetical protein